MSDTLLPKGFDFTDPDIYVDRIPFEEFALLRQTAPVWFCEQPFRTSGFDDNGYYVVTRHADVRAVSLDTDTYSTWQNTAIIRFNAEIERDAIDAQRFVMLNMDPPDHTPLRRIVSRGFTPRAVAKLRDALAERAEKIVAEAKAQGSGNFVTDIAAELPLQAIAELIGVPQTDRGKIFEWSNQMIGYDDPELALDPEGSSIALLGYAMQMAEQRRGCPMDDIATKLVQADINGEALSPDEFGFFVLLLAVAGNETTRNAITHGMQFFFDNPEQWELYKAERPETTADEIVRMSTPVVSFQRTVKRETELGGVPLSVGDRVGLFYSAANHDPDVFDDPFRFDIRRDPNPHLGFGGGGPHYCLGANLAKVEMDLMFNAIADQMPNIAPLAAPRRLRSGWINGIKELAVTYD